ncbi:ATP-grasp fold amidoligase family protein [Facklamia hominis]|uniref:ATP-grasp fold amidoligase family protein n=1 Tax=Facklamia hominis TaxID=178214 RepID=UPI0003541BE8|nr:ATP-grasp fold amidoligase family protein [Facklamia hominis]EPH12728.1 hypothetical protein HMPREF9260_00316 [Facklamia hominis ACS-120-V-Sch10]
MKNVHDILSSLNYRGFLKFIPDKLWLKYRYKLIFSKKLSLDSPSTFNEKLQWLKLNYKNPLCTKLVDKIEVKKYIEDKIGAEYLIPNLGVWNTFDEIDFDSLPNQFVLKCNHDSGGLIICRNKFKLNKKCARKKIEKCLKTNYFWHGREWVYKDIVPRVFAEQYMEDASADKLIDYKFYCFNGQPKCLYVSSGLENHNSAEIAFFDLNFEIMPFTRNDYNQFKILPKKPNNFYEMIKIAKTLSEGFPFVRVDLYEINNQVYFSELTFIPSSGWMPIEPNDWDVILGNWLELPK